MTNIRIREMFCEDYDDVVELWQIADGVCRLFTVIALDLSERWLPLAANRGLLKS